jgi:F420H(2)-dependent quinone reductase
VNRGQRAFTAIETRRFRRAGKSLGGRIARAPVLLITTTGRHTGLRRTTPLVYVPHGDRSLLVVAAYGGAPWHPAWYLNLLAEPTCMINVSGQERRAHAHLVLGQEREQLWPLMRSSIASLPKAERRTRRTIPLVRIHCIE